MLVFAPLAWMKLQYFCHVGDSEIAGFAVSSARDPLYVERFETVLQGATAVTVELSDDAVADYFDRCVDQGLPPQRFGRVWCHTHPGSSAEPSITDERTFDRVFGRCDWAVMFILSRTGETYARLSFSAGPGGAVHLPVRVDWARWPLDVAGGDDPQALAASMRQWRAEYDANVRAVSGTLGLTCGAAFADGWGQELDLLAEDFDGLFDADVDDVADIVVANADDDAAPDDGDDGEAANLQSPVARRVEVRS